MSWLSDLFGGGGYSAAQSQLNNYYGKAASALSPYASAGNNVLPQLTGAASALLNPSQLEQQWGASYTESPEAKAAEAMAEQNGLGAASSMGLSGSTPALSAIQMGTSDIGLQDKQNYLKDLMQKYIAGINVDRGIYSTGASAAGEEGNLYAQQGQQDANLAYGQAEAGPSFLTSLLGKAAGWAAGGPIGAAVGSQIASHL